MRVLIFTLLFSVFASSAFATLDKKQLLIRLQAQSGYLDQTTVYFDQGIAATYNGQEDAQKVFNTVAGVPQLYSITSDNIPCSINGYSPLSNSEIVPLGFIVDAAGTYTISAPQINNFDPTMTIRLEDRAGGQIYDLRMGSVQVQLDPSDPQLGRFYIRATTAAQFNETTAGCSNADGEVSVTLDPAVTWTNITLYDNMNNQIGSLNNVNGSANFPGLAEGDYYMLLVFGSYTTTKDLHVDGNYIVADVTASKVLASIGEFIDFHAITTHANQFDWDFGDGTLIVGVANPTLAYYEAGTYNVTMNCSNGTGCSDQAQITVVITQASAIEEVDNSKLSVFASGKTVRIQLNDEIANGALINVYNLLGQPVYGNALLTQTSIVNFDEQPMGFYLVSVKNGTKTYTQKILLAN